MLRYLFLFFASLAQAAVVVVTTTGTPLTDGAALQTAMSAANCGDILVVQAGSIYRSPDSNDNPIDTRAIDCRENPITIQSSRAEEIAGRVALADEAKMATFDTPRSWGVIRISNGTRGLKFRGIIFTTASTNMANARFSSNLIDYVSPTLGTNGPIEFDQCMCRPYEATQTDVYNITVEKCIAHSDGELRVSRSYFYGFNGRSNVAAKSISAATESSTDPQVTATSHGYGSTTSTQITGATGDWARMNGHNRMVVVDTNTLSWRKHIGRVSDSGSTATVWVVFKAAHYLEVGDSVTFSGFTNDTDLNATYTIASIVDDYSFTVTTTNVTDGNYCHSSWITCTYVEDSALLAVDTTGYGSLTGTVEMRSGSSTNSYCVMSISPFGPVRVVDSYFDCEFSVWFTGGGNRQYRNSATFSSATASGGTMSNTRDLRVGELMTVQTSCTGGSGGFCYKTVKLETIDHSTGEVTWSTFGQSGLPVNDTGTATTSGSTMTFVSGTNGCQENSGGNDSGRWNRGYTITIDGDPYTIGTCNTGSTIGTTTTIGTNASPVAYTVAQAPNVPGDVRWNFVPVAEGSVWRGNTFDKNLQSAGYAGAGLCKAYHELKAVAKYLFDGNTYIGEPCVGNGHPSYSQTGADVGGHHDGLFTNSLLKSGERYYTGYLDDPYHTSTTVEHWRGGSRNERYINHISLGHTRFTGLFGTVGGFDGMFKNITFTYNDSVYPSVGVTEQCISTSTPPRRYVRAKFFDMIAAFGANGLAHYAGCVDWPSQLVGNLFVDTNSVGSYGADYANSTRLTSFNDIGYVGTCDHVGDNWRNCKLDTSSAYKGTASDGGDPGADVDLIYDRINRYSEQAGLIDYWTGREKSAPWSLGSTKVGLRFQIFGAIGGCTVELFTDINRVTEHADATTAQDCDRTGSVVNGNLVNYVFGQSSALTANTTYYYKITDGTRLLIGSFKTFAAGSGRTLRWSKAMECGTDGATFGTAVPAGNSFAVPTGEIRYCRESSPVGNVKIITSP